MKKITAFFRNMRIRSKLLGGFTLIFILATLLGGTAIYFQVKSTIEANIESELKNSTETILNMVKTAAGTSIKNHLRAVAEKNKQIIEAIYEDYQSGRMTEEAAKVLAKKILLSQTIGKTGYLYCVRSDGIAPIHPRPGVAGNNFLDQWFVREQIRLKDGYLEYDWKNPEEDHEKPKALYMSYFEPWDWIISASSYRDEFKELVNVSDFKDSILALLFGKTGYAYVLDSKGNLIVHPTLSGNYFDAQGRDGQFFIHEICRLKNGKLIYSWKNPGETAFRKKIVLFNYIPEYDWIVACSSYLDEMYAPLNTIRNIILLAVCVIMALVFFLSLWITGSVLHPLRHLMNRLSLGASGDLSVRMPVTSKDEIGQLAGFFNKFMETLELYNANLTAEIKIQKRIETALRLSEEMFSKAFQCSPSGMFIASLKDGRVINVNDSFLNFTGYTHSNIIDNDLAALGFFQNKTDGPKLMKQLTQKRHLKNMEIKFQMATGENRTGLLSAEIVELWGEECILAAMEDLTESRQLEREILTISEQERQKIAMELHDDICPQLIGIEVMTKILVEKLEEKAIDEASDAFKIRQFILDTIAKTRQLSKGLSPVNLSDHGFDLSLEELANYIQEVFGIVCVFKYSGGHPIRDNSVATHLYYIAHEAVHNAARHSNAKKISIDLTISPQKITLIVRDDGRGMDTVQHAHGMGLKIMTYRAQRIGATLNITQHATGGTLVRLDIET
ncbi:MAG: cache domain-containing protein [Proteobacteria bacterium]|nr:cache domain-containing protein [Pseudomonadota bacterium]MBU1584255.1 cache domain-containing protein [Pseudomonadota bacterium]MBU2455505.1 cache domain-containing protein [Pseudomonadota bacterium]MBU2629395.1 cache domain-containing protein [Pseudomonadota bacterium]